MTEISKYLEDVVTTDLKFEEAKSKDPAILGYLVGKIQQFGINQNQRAYPRPVWEEMLADNRFKERLAKGQLVGGLGHPKDGIFDPVQTGVKLIEMWIEGEDVLGRLEILNTPVGQIINSLYLAKVLFGVSSRGRGPSHSSGGTTIVDLGFFLEGFDVVIEPSVIDAEPQFELAEQMIAAPVKNFYTFVDGRLAVEEIEVEEVKAYGNLLEKLYKDKESENYILLESKIQAKEDQFTTDDTPEVKDKKTPPDVDSDEEDKSLLGAQDKEDNKGKSKKPKKELEMKKEDQSPDTNNNNNNSLKFKIPMEEQLKKLTEANKALQKQISDLESKSLTEATVATDKKLEERDTTILKLYEDNESYKLGKGELEADLTAAKQLIEAFLVKSKDMSAKIAESKADLGASIQIIESLRKNKVTDEKQVLSSLIEQKISSLPEGIRAKGSVILKTAKDTKQLESLMAGISVFNFPTDPTLPTPTTPIVGKKKKQEAGKRVGMNPLSEMIARTQNPAAFAN